MSDWQDGVPTVMAFAGLDPTGGAGLQADIEAVMSMGGHALPVITAITVQDTHDVKRATPVEAFDVIEQARAVLEDIPVGAFKLGMLGSVAIVEAVHTILAEHPGVPVVLDPVCASGAGTRLTDDEQIDAVVSLLLPQTTVLTPNSSEARLLAPASDSASAAAHQLISSGCDYVLVTGTDDDTPDVVHQLYGDMRLIETYTFERLPGAYHGSGCTLAAAIAALLAHGSHPQAAVAEALDYAWGSLAAGHRIGTGQLVPNRLHRAAARPRRVQ